MKTLSSHRLWTVPAATAIAATLLFGMTQQASAGAVAYSNLNITNFTASSGGTQLDVSDFDFLTIGNFTKAEAKLGAASSADDDFSTGSSDVPMQCLGPACAGIAENTFTQVGAGIFSRGDAFLSGALITGPGLPGSATGQTVGEFRIDSSTASNGGTVGTTTEFSFSTDNDTAITFEFDASGQLFVEITDGTGQAFASMAFSIQIVDDQGNEIFTYDPSELNTSRGQLSEGSKNYLLGLTGFSVTTPVLDADITYTLSINHQSTTSGLFTPEVDVPAPATLLIFGMGLLGLAVLKRRSA